MTRGFKAAGRLHVHVSTRAINGDSPATPLPAEEAVVRGRRRSREADYPLPDDCLCSNL